MSESVSKPESEPAVPSSPLMETGEGTPVDAAAPEDSAAEAQQGQGATADATPSADEKGVATETTAAEKAPDEPKARKARMSTAQMLHLMRLEVDRAIRHRYPISCIVLGLDEFSDADDHVHRKELMPQIFGKLKRVTFQNDVRGLGIWSEHYQLAVFPHVDPTQLADLAEQLLEAAREVESPRWGEQHITISIGIAHNLHEGEISFDSLVQEAETGMGLAMAAGGNRFIRALEVESEVDRLRVELETQIEEIKQHQASYFGDKDGEEENWAKGLIAKVLDAFVREKDQNEGVVRLKKEVIALLTGELQEWRSTSTVSQLLESQRQIEQLERRVRKLTDSLGVTEKELKRVMAMKSIDVGVASIYRTVQGLSDEDDSAEQKRGMLKNIFEANLALRSDLAASKT